MEFGIEASHSALTRRGDLVTTSLCTSQWRRRYVPNETPSDVSMERRQDVSVVRLHDVILERRNDVSKGRNNDVPSVRFHDVSNKSQMKHPTTSQWYVQGRLSGTYPLLLLVRLYDLSCKSQIKHPKMVLWYVSTKSRSHVLATSC